jgi:uncharacterized protein YbjT (DUF2867 family)
MVSSQKILVLGGTSFVGRTFCELVTRQHSFDLTLLNRGLTNTQLFPTVPRLICDRNREQECKQKLAGSHWSSIIDFSGQEDQQIRNVLSNCSCDHYVFLSSSAVDLSWPGDPIFEMAKSKLWCEHLISRLTSNCLIVRAGFICGEYDYTERFAQKNGLWFWRGTDHMVHPMIRSDILSNTLVQSIGVQRTGVLKAGYR